MKKITIFMVSMALSMIFLLKVSQAATDFNQAVKNASHSGQFRLAYISTSPDVADAITTSAMAIGGQLKMETAEWNHLQFAVAPYFSQKMVLLSGDENEGKLNGDFFDASNDSFAYLGEAYLNYNYKWDSSEQLKGSLRIGRQQLDNPFINTDDIRILHNTFNAIWLNMAISPILLLEAGRVKTWAGFDSGSSQDKFKAASNDSVTALGLHYSHSDLFAAQAWIYDFDQNYSLFYTDMFYSPNLHYISGTLELAAQYARYNEDMASNIDGTASGLSVAYNVGALTLRAAINSTSNDTGKVVDSGLGGGNYFTSMDEITIAGLTDASAYLLAVDYQLSEALSASVAMGHFEDNNTATIDIDEIDIVLAYTANDNLDIEFIHTDVENNAVPADAGTNFTRQLLRVNYNF